MFDIKCKVDSKCCDGYRDSEGNCRIGFLIEKELVVCVLGVTAQGFGKRIMKMPCNYECRSGNCE